MKVGAAGRRVLVRAQRRRRWVRRLGRLRIRGRGRRHSGLVIGSPVVVLVSLHSGDYWPGHVLVMGVLSILTCLAEEFYLVANAFGSFEEGLKGHRVRPPL